jgi:hypothetical protein
MDTQWTRNGHAMHTCSVSVVSVCVESKNAPCHIPSLQWLSYPECYATWPVTNAKAAVPKNITPTMYRRSCVVEVETSPKPTVVIVTMEK